MNRLLITLLLALGFALSFVSLAQSNDASKATLPSTGKPPHTVHIKDEVQPAAKAKCDSSTNCSEIIVEGSNNLKYRVQVRADAQNQSHRWTVSAADCTTCDPILSDWIVQDANHDFKSADGTKKFADQLIAIFAGVKAADEKTELAEKKHQKKIDLCDIKVISGEDVKISKGSTEQIECQLEHLKELQNSDREDATDVAASLQDALSKTSDDVVAAKMRGDKLNAKQEKILKLFGESEDPMVQHLLLNSANANYSLALQAKQQAYANVLTLQMQAAQSAHNGQTELALAQYQQAYATADALCPARACTAGNDLAAAAKFVKDIGIKMNQTASSNDDFIVTPQDKAIMARFNDITHDGNLLMTHVRNVEMDMWKATNGRVTAGTIASSDPFADTVVKGAVLTNSGVSLGGTSFPFELRNDEHPRNPNLLWGAYDPSRYSQFSEPAVPTFAPNLRPCGMGNCSATANPILPQNQVPSVGQTPGFTPMLAPMIGPVTQTPPFAPQVNLQRTSGRVGAYN